MDLIIWGILGVFIVVFTFIALFKGLSDRVASPNKELKEKVSKLESRVNELEDKN